MDNFVVLTLLLNMVGTLLLSISYGMDKYSKNSKKEELISILYTLGLFLVVIAGGLAAGVLGSIVYYSWI
jgi:hypothetical protein